MKTEQPHELLFEALVEIKKDLHEKIGSLDERIRRAQLECAENAFQQQKDALADCVDGIDEELVKLSVYLEEYWRLYASFNDLNRKISGFGGTPLPVPDPLAGDSLATVLAGRFEYLNHRAGFEI